MRSNNDGKNIAAKLAEAPPSPSRVSAEAYTAESVTFLEQDSTTVPNFANRSILSCGNLVGVATPSPPFCGLRRLKNPRKNIFGFFKKPFRFAPCFSPIGERANHKKKGAESHEKIQHGPPPPGNQHTVERGRIRRVFRACHSLQIEPSRVYPARPY